jgi:hypothetical protein
MYEDILAKAMGQGERRALAGDGMPMLSLAEFLGAFESGVVWAASL